jgi:hypothetical protein
MPREQRESERRKRKEGRGEKEKVTSRCCSSREMKRRGLLCSLSVVTHSPLHTLATLLTTSTPSFVVFFVGPAHFSSVPSVCSSPPRRCHSSRHLDRHPSLPSSSVDGTAQLDSTQVHPQSSLSSSSFSFSSRTDPPTLRRNATNASSRQKPSHSSVSSSS